MNKTRTLYVIMNSVFIIVFNIMFFVLSGSDRNASIWISYSFVHFSYFMLLATDFLIRGGKSVAVFGFSLYSISSAYFLVELIVGVSFIVASPEGYKASLLVQLAIAGAYVIMLVSHMIANEHTAEAEEKRQIEIDYIKKAASEVASILNGISDRDTRRKIERVYDAIHSSPVKSHPSLISLESQILSSVGDLVNLAQTSDKDSVTSQSESLLKMVYERNRLLKMRN